MSESTASISFLADCEHKIFEKCEKISKSTTPCKYNFINRFIVNENEDRPVIFLGYLDSKDTYQGLVGKYLEIKPMVIPKHSTFINANGLKNYLHDPNTPKDGAFIPDAELQGDKLEDYILLNVCVGVSETGKESFHFCDNYGDDPPYELGSATCCKPVPKIYFNSQNPPKLQYGLLPFYISWDDIEKKDEKDKHWVLKDRLIEYFDYYGKKLHNDINPINKHTIKGLFLLPRIQVDQSIIYLCLLNQSSESYKYSIKETLRFWFEKFDEFNNCDEATQTKELAMKGEDLFLCSIEQWSIKIGCLATPVVKCKNKSLS